MLTWQLTWKMFLEDQRRIAPVWILGLGALVLTFSHSAWLPRLVQELFPDKQREEAYSQLAATASHVARTSFADALQSQLPDCVGEVWQRTKVCLLLSDRSLSNNTPRDGYFTVKSTVGMKVPCNDFEAMFFKRLEVEKDDGLWRGLENATVQCSNNRPTVAVTIRDASSLQQ